MYLNKIIKTCQARRGLKKYAHRANLQEIRENDFNLNIPRYVDIFEEEAEIDIEAVQKEIKTLESELVQVRGRMATLLKEIKQNE